MRIQSCSTMDLDENLLFHTDQLREPKGQLRLSRAWNQSWRGGHVLGRQGRVRCDGLRASPGLSATHLPFGDSWLRVRILEFSVREAAGPVLTAPG